jgi:Na+/phosphate symporter
MIVSYVSVLFMLVGVLMYALAGNPKVAEIGRILFACGTLALALAIGGKGLRLF